MQARLKVSLIDGQYAGLPFVALMICRRRSKIHTRLGSEYSSAELPCESPVPDI